MGGHPGSAPGLEQGKVCREAGGWKGWPQLPWELLCCNGKLIYFGILHLQPGKNFISGFLSQKKKISIYFYIPL